MGSSYVLASGHGPFTIHDLMDVSMVFPWVELGWKENGKWDWAAAL